MTSHIGGVAEQFHFYPQVYLELVLAEVPAYVELQDTIALATGVGREAVLELGVGTGETTRRVLARHPDASLIGIDESEGMVAAAATVVPEADLRVGRLEDPLPAGPFDLVVAALAVHHLDGPGKADLFARVRAVLAVGGRFVMGDVVVPDDPADAITPLDREIDSPSTIDEQLEWLSAAGLAASVVWRHRDLVVIAADG